jgi:hypothetical protein
LAANVARIIAAFGRDLAASTQRFKR